MTEPMKYRKKPVVIEAMQWTGDGSYSDEAIINWIFSHDDSADLDEVKHNDGWHLIIRTLEGKMGTQIGDFIICGVQGEFYPCKPEIFEQTYEIVDDD